MDSIRGRSKNAVLQKPLMVMISFLRYKFCKRNVSLIGILRASNDEVIETEESFNERTKDFMEMKVQVMSFHRSCGFEY